MSLLKRMQISGLLTIALSVGNVIVLWTAYEEAIQQQRKYYRGVFDGNVNSKRNTSWIVGEYWKLPGSIGKEIVCFELVLNIFNIVACTFQLVYNLKKIRLWITLNFLIFGGPLFGISFVAFNLIFICGFMSIHKYFYHVLLMAVYFWFIFQVLRAMEEASHREKEEDDDLSRAGMEGSQVSLIDEGTTETQLI